MSDSPDPAVRKFQPRSDGVVPLQAVLEGKGQAGSEDPAVAAAPQQETEPGKVPEIGGRRKGLDPTRYGDWEKDGRCIDF